MRDGRLTIAALVAAAALIAAPAAGAALQLEPGSPYAVGADPYGVVSGDFDGDGRPDAATIDGTSSDVSLLLRQPGGGFAAGPGSPIAVGAGPSGAAVADLNGDGRLDLAVANFVGASVSVLLGAPGGGFTLENGQALALPGRASGIAAGDLNGDGRPDLAVALNDSDQVAVLVRNAADDGFTLQQTYATGAQPGPIAIADVNGDGLDDIAVAGTGDGSVTVLLRAAGAGFAPEPPLAVGARPAGIVAADFNGDGRADLAVSSYAASTVAVLLRRAADDGFAPAPGSPVAVSASPVGIARGDLDGDGRADLAVAANSGAVDVLHGDAAGGFARSESVPVAGTPNGVAIADFDGDGRGDVAVSEISGSTFSLLVNPAPASPGPPAPPAPPVPPAPLPAPVAGRLVNVEPVSGSVTIRLPGADRFVALTAGRQIPVGTTVDTRRGRVTLIAVQGRGATAAADFYGGIFKLAQSAGARPLATLTLTQKLSCPRRGRAAAAAAKPKTRQLWGSGSGRFRTNGSYSAATVRGTRWLTRDSCTSTLTRVARGVVSVRDKVKRTTTIVRAGGRYVARRR